MTTTSARRQPHRGKAAGARAFPHTVQATEPPELGEPVKEEVDVEPDLPVETEKPFREGPVPDHVPGREEYDRLVAAMPPTEPVYVAGNRAPRLKVGAYTLQPGDIVPGAHGWPRREAYERLGRIERR